MLSRTLFCGAALAALVSAQNSTFLRGDTVLTTEPGILQNVSTSNIDVGFNQVDICSPHQFVPGSGNDVATSRLVYAVFPDLEQATGNVELRVRRSIDGGRSWEAPVTIYTVDTAAGEDLNTGDEGTHIYAYENQVFVTFQTNVHNLSSSGQSLWAIGSPDQGRTWSAPLNVSTGWSRTGGQRDFDVDDASASVSSNGLSLVWEADFEDPSNPGTGSAGNENLYFSRIELVGNALAATIPETALTAYSDGTFDVDLPTIDTEGDFTLIAWVDDSFNGLAPGNNATVSIQSFDGGVTFTSPYIHSGTTAGTFPLGWAAPRRPWALIDLPFAFVIQEDSRFDQDDVFMDRADVDLVNQNAPWTTTEVQVNFTSTISGSGDIDGIVCAAANGVLAIMYRDDSAGTPLDNSNEAYLVVDRTFGFDLINGTEIQHVVTTTSTGALDDIEIVDNMIAAVVDGGTFPNDGLLVCSHDGGVTIETSCWTALGSCGTGEVDVDDLRLAVSLNKDFNIAYVDNRSGLPVPTNADNQSYVTGGKLPRLAYDNSTATVTIDKIDPRESAAGSAFLMISAGTSPGTDVNAFLGVGQPGSGYFVGLQQDLFFVILWANVLPFLAPIATDGTATIPSVPNGTAIIGLPIYVAGGTLQFNLLPNDILKSYTDPVVQ